MAREASIQLTYQNALIIYQFLYPPMLELNLNSWSYPSAHWMSFLGLQMISILLSGYSTFNPVIVDIQFQNVSQKRLFGLTNYLVIVFQMLIHIVIASGVVFLLRGHTFILIIRRRVFFYQGTFLLLRFCTLHPIEMILGLFES